MTREEGTKAIFREYLLLFPGCDVNRSSFFLQINNIFKKSFHLEGKYIQVVNPTRFPWLLPRSAAMGGGGGGGGLF